MHMAFSNSSTPGEMPLRNCAHINNEIYATIFIVAVCNNSGIGNYLKCSSIAKQMYKL